MTRRRNLDWNMNLKRSYLFASLLLLFYTFQILRSEHCDNYGVSKSNLELAIDLIGKVKSYFPNGSTLSQDNICLPMDCDEVLLSGHNSSGVYTVWPRNRLTDGKPLNVYCDMDTENGGWTVIQRRGNFNNPRYYFYKGWSSYKIGFGDIEEDFWLGNDNIYALTNQREYSIRFDLQNLGGEKRYALYDYFWIDDEKQKYMLHIDGYSGTAGDSMIRRHANRNFSTKDQDNDGKDDRNCAQISKGGWWYSDCYASNLNGAYHDGGTEHPHNGIKWYSFTFDNASLAATEMKIRPINSKRKFITKNPL